MGTNQSFHIKAGLTVQKPANEVFEAIVDPLKMSNYFISKSTGRLEEGKKLEWSFPEMDMSFPIRVGKIEKDKFISYYWNDIDGTETFVEMKLETTKIGTHISITEKGHTNDEAGIAWFGRNTEGWANFLACLKAWLEYGINLRKGAFEPSQMPTAANN